MTYADPGLFLRARSRSVTARIPPIAIAAILVALAYYVGAKLGVALTMPPTPVSTLWPPNTLVMAALLLTPTSWWWALLLAVLPVHLAIELNSGFPTLLVFGWFVSNSTEALIGATLVRKLLDHPIRFDRSRDVGIYIFSAAFAATFLSSFIDVGFVTLAGSAPSGYWSLFSTRFLSNTLTSLTVGAFVLAWSRGVIHDITRTTLKRYLEGIILAVALVAVSFFVFNRQTPGHTTTDPISLYAPLPFLLWATVRFGPRATTASLLTISLLAIWGADHGRGPFLISSPAENAVSIQIFLIAISIPFLVLCAVIREREHAERSARQNEGWLNLALGAAEVGAWEWRISENVVSTSAKSKELIGLSTFDGRTLEEFLAMVVPEDRPPLESRIREAVEVGGTYETEFRVMKPTGEIAWILGKGQVVRDDTGRPRRVIGVSLDITERKNAENLRRDEMALRESEARLRELADAMPQIVWAADRNGNVDYLNDRWYELTGANTLGTDATIEMIYPEDRPAIAEMWRVALQTGEAIATELRLYEAKTGRYRWHLVRAEPVRDETGAVVRWYGSSTDIEDQKRVEEQLRHSRLHLEASVTERTAELSRAVVALREEITDRVNVEEALRSSEERFAKAFHSSPDAIVIIRQTDYRVIEINEKAESMFGYPRSEVIGRSYDDFGLLVHNEDRVIGRRLVEASGRLKEVEMDLRHRTGKILHVVLVSDTVDMAGVPCFIVIIRDVTERKRSDIMLAEQQRELAHLSRVAALGELSGALAHELNQPLAAILSNARAAQRMLPPDAPHSAELREILEDIAADDRRAGEVISRLRAFLKKSDVQLRPIHPTDIVKEVLGLLHSDLIQRRVSVVTQIPSSLPMVMGDKVQLQQVLLNLVLNACDAMANLIPRERQLTIRGELTDDESVQISVRDRGVGIATPRLEQIFDPFITTKESGLGLGLAICRSIVSAHGGRLWAVNNLDHGATFILSLNPAGTTSAGRIGPASTATISSES